MNLCHHWAARARPSTEPTGSQRGVNRGPPDQQDHRDQRAPTGRMCPASLHQTGFKVSNHRCLCKPPAWWQRHINSLNARRQAHFPARSPSRIPVPRFGTSRVDKTLPYPLLISFCRASVPLTCSGLTHSSDAASRCHSPFVVRYRLPAVPGSLQRRLFTDRTFGDMIAANRASCPSCGSRWEGSGPLNASLPVPVPTYDHGPNDNPNFNVRGATYSPPMVWYHPVIRGCRPCRSLPAVSGGLMILDADRC